MNDERQNGFMMIGLHKLAAQNGDGLVPELYELLRRDHLKRLEYPNVETFPAWEARRPGEEPLEPLGDAARDGKNIVAFAAKTGEKSSRKRQV
ncbi:hypothetical protein LJR030_005332 [Rhizobium sp. LjRoot30]|uniref:hypothetical protein n=1 Tax=Rhizobium sp. LjRoot30 TaxID=3342320 RepID=UPI003ED0F481